MSHDILGDKPKHNFDDNLADIVNAKFEEEERLEKLKQGKNKKQDPENSLQNDIILNVGNRTAKEWLKYAEENNLNLFSIVDFYEMAKKCNQSDKQADSLRKDLRENGLVTCTVIDYQGMHDVRRNVKAFRDFDPNYVFFKGVITHSNHSGFESLKYLNDKIPILEEGASLKEIKEKYTFAQDFLRTLFGTDDLVEMITTNLCNFTQLPETRIKLYTLGRRHIVKAREVVIKYENNNLLILCDRNDLKGNAWRVK
ncbi:hypothetical protein HZA97_01110 [Candidatus Woesearchaeota archaeon]|nr:hypothetical protein [Candidatus Woesearchaeota archaeon]